MKKKLSLGVISLISCVFLSACGNSTESVNKQSKEISDISFVETARNNTDTLWYRVYNQDVIDGNSSIESIVVTKNGKSILYETSDKITFDDIAGLSDQEIQQKAKELDEITFREKVTEVENEYNRTLEKANKDFEYQVAYKDDVTNGNPDVLAGLTDSIPKFENDIKYLKDLEYISPVEKAVEAFVVVTDDQTVEETIDLPNRSVSYNEWYYDGLSKKLINTSDNGFFYEDEDFREVDFIHPLSIKISDNFYSGYSNESMDLQFLTKVTSDKQIVSLDKIGSEGVNEK